jgi:hypothetical protein
MLVTDLMVSMGSCPARLPLGYHNAAIHRNRFQTRANKEACKTSMLPEHRKSSQASATHRRCPPKAEAGGSNPFECANNFNDLVRKSHAMFGFGVADAGSMADLRPART